MKNQKLSSSDTEEKPRRKARIFLHKLLFFPLIRLIIALFFLWVGYLLSMILMGQLSIPQDAHVIRELNLIIFVAATYVVYVRLIERRPVREFFLGNALKELCLGIVIGGGMITIIVGILWVFGMWQVEGINLWSVIAIPLVTTAATAVWEEIVFRGIVFRMLEEGLGTWLALFISALIFGLLHFGNENASIMGVLTIAATAGFLLASVYILTRRLWLAIGVHYSVNLLQGPVFGLPVSGKEVTGLLQSSLEGPELLTGGTFGIEASLITVLIATGIVIYMLRKAFIERKFVSPLWNSKRSLSDGGILPNLK